MADKIEIDKGSFRDPSGYVFYYEGDVYRKVDEKTWVIMRELADKGLLEGLADKKWIVKTELVSTGSEIHKNLCSASSEAEYGRFLHHERIPFVSYPYEWSFRMLQDAAILQLNLQMYLLEKGYSLKDASVYNITFNGNEPIFIDIPSIEIPASMDAWIAYDQFCRMYLFPLFLMSFESFDLRSYYMAHFNGMSIDEVYHAIGPVSALRPVLFLDVFFQKHLQKLSVDRMDVGALKTKIKSGGQDPTAQILNLKRLRHIVRKLSYKSGSQTKWTDYTKTHSYSSDAEDEKKKFVRSFLSEQKPARVLDLGCNTGDYSFIAGEAGASVVAVDSDHDTVDAFYKLAKRGDANVLPLWIDLVNPSPRLGFRNHERKSFLDRADSDCVLALALIHHLLITTRVPMEAICDFLHNLTSRYLIVEFIGREDAMFQKLLALREDIYGHITEEYFEKLLNSRFNILKKHNIPGAKRTLYACEKKGAMG